MIYKPFLKGKGFPFWHQQRTHGTTLCMRCLYVTVYANPLPFAPSVSLGLNANSLQDLFCPNSKLLPCSNMGRCSQSSTAIWATEWANLQSVFRKDSPGSRCPSIHLHLSASSVSGLGVELLADVVDDLGYKLVEVVELVHEEGVLLVGVCGDVLQLILGCPGNADGVGDHT